MTARGARALAAVESSSPGGVAQGLLRAADGDFAGEEAIDGFDLDVVGILGDVIDVRAGDGARPAGEDAAFVDGAEVLAHGLMADAELMRESETTAV